MLINHPTDGATCVFLVFNSNHQAAICISIELYEIVQRRCSVAVVVGVVGLTLRGRGGPLIRSGFFLNRT